MLNNNNKKNNNTFGGHGSDSISQRWKVMGNELEESFENGFKCGNESNFKEKKQKAVK